MSPWLNRLFGRGDKGRERYVLFDAKVKQYREDGANTWRWARYERFSDREDPKGELMRARHSKPGLKTMSFAEASADALSFRGDFVELIVRGERVEHIDLVNQGEGTRSGLSRWRLADGSLLTEEVRFGSPAELVAPRRP